MDMIHIFFKFQDQSSLAYITRISTRSMITFEKMKEGIGTTINYFDKEENVHLKIKVIEVRQATPGDYKKLHFKLQTLNITNKQLEQTCKKLFNRLNETRQLEVLLLYALKELKFTEAKATEFAFQTLKEKKHWPKAYQRYATPQAKNKMYLWHYINWVLPDWKSTHHEIVAYIMFSILKEESGLITNIYNYPDRLGTQRLWTLASEWADKFTETYIGHDLREHGEYFEKLEDFCKHENQNLEAYAHL